MAKKKAGSASEKKTKATVKKLEVKVERLEAKVARWKDEAKQSGRELAQQRTRADKLEKKLSKARTSRPVAGPASRDDTAVEATATSSATDEASTPDATWTVAQLRAEGRSRGLTGLSNKSKAQLVQALTAPR